MEKVKQVVLVSKKRPINTKEELEKTIDILLMFFKKDIRDTIEYIEEGEIVVDHITPGKRIDLHPTREYLLRMPRILNELQSLRERIDDSDDLIDDFYKDL